MALTVAAVALEIFGKGLPFAIRKLMKMRLQQAQKILLEELHLGHATTFDIADEDEVSAMVFEFASAAQKGAARRNLRIIAQVMAGAVLSRPVYADDFLRWSHDLSSLSREEIIALGVLGKNYEVAAKLSTHDDSANRRALTFTLTMSDLLGPNKLCTSAEELYSLFGALTRTGLVVSWSSGTLYYSPSAKLRRLLQIVDLDRVINSD